ncbi:hypothetical protein MGAS9429_Spy0730 [Streptococcus pyogenes MGAS9429]|uniref:Phage protein n=1 Tax=Streptococcus pyogenes serotype M12 (strain MGAS9429) TaxID=370551 RepID=Q1JM94_STRPC|nr:hypothetical protein MGAS9429_Spy0730 [Streptococcus pyogenes MGAS9429]ABF33798.1 hypothetical protein MGAS10270_Spy0733 [Streptococcus pyogenes MGAS10270]ABF35798.1 hypothetical protein MGAS2096_Spy0746 [Streptococcus pyogenes MGAS2096]ABF37717.1 hypothetical protein MGAS10750_Spy0767 [Streptococcus pyogenes MGAS10750]
MGCSLHYGASFLLLREEKSSKKVKSTEKLDRNIQKIYNTNY